MVLSWLYGMYRVQCAYTFHRSLISTWPPAYFWELGKQVTTPVWYTICHFGINGRISWISCIIVPSLTQICYQGMSLLCVSGQRHCYIPLISYDLMLWVHSLCMTGTYPGAIGVSWRFRWNLLAIDSRGYIRVSSHLVLFEPKRLFSMGKPRRSSTQLWSDMLYFRWQFLYLVRSCFSGSLLSLNKSGP